MEINASMKIGIYNTSKKSEAEISKEFILRQEIVQQIIEDLENADFEYPEQDYLISGDDGMGKTMILTKLKFSIQQNSNLNPKLIALQLSEELNGVINLDDFWACIIKELEEKEFGFIDQVKLFKEKYESIDSLGLLVQCLKSLTISIVLLVDDFDVLLSKFSKKDENKLREILITEKSISVIASCSVDFENIYRYDKAFFDHFFVYKLKPLSIKECKELFFGLAHNSEHEHQISNFIKDNFYRIQLIRDFSGGSLKTMIRYFNIVIKEESKSLYAELNMLLDEISDKYLFIIKGFEKKQLKLIDSLAKTWEASWVSDIAAKVNMKSNEVSAQLKNLEENEVIFSLKSANRKKLYMLKNRLFNLWYLRRYACSDFSAKTNKIIDVYKYIYGKDERKKVARTYLMNDEVLRLNEPKAQEVGPEGLEMAISLLKVGELAKSIEIADKLLNDKKYILENKKIVFSYLQALLKSGNFHLVNNYFQNAEFDLKNEFLPVYYTMMYFLEDKYPNEYKRMPIELNGIVLNMIDDLKTV